MPPFLAACGMASRFPCPLLSDSPLLADSGLMKYDDGWMWLTQRRGRVNPMQHRSLFGDHIIVPTTRTFRVFAAFFLAFFAMTVSTAEPAATGGHVTQIDRPVLAAEEGLMLGNGDLSVEHLSNGRLQIIWRFGKGDVWDRRFDRSDDPKPPHINEVAHGIEVEGWKCGPYGGPVEATRGTKNPKRMREICQSCPPSYTSSGRIPAPSRSANWRFIFRPICRA